MRKIGVILAYYREFENRVSIISDRAVVTETGNGKK